MSVKCGYSSIYYPVLKSLLRGDSPDLNAFKVFVNDHFINPDEVFNMFASGVYTDSTPTPVSEPKKVSSRLGIELPPEGSSPQQYYIGNSRQYNKMIDDTAKRIISMSVFDIHTDSFVDANAILGSYSNLNTGIFKYKLELLRVISEFMGKPLDPIDIDSEPKTIVDTFENVIKDYEAYIKNADITQDQKYFNSYNAYVTLKTFDDILRLYTPFISIKPEYKNSSIYAIGRYNYDGPNVTHYTGFSNNEFMGAEESVSDLAKILLSYFPEVNEDGVIIDNTAITLSGFNSTMSKLKLFMEESIDPEVVDEIAKGGNMDVSKIIGKYLNALAAKSVAPEHVTYLQNKLRGIAKFIYSDKMALPIKQMFTHLMNKTVLSSYISYGKDNLTGDLTGKNLTDRPITIQRYFVMDVVKAASIYWIDNKVNFQNKLGKYDINIIGNNVIITEGSNTLNLKYNPDTGEFSSAGLISDALMDDLLMDFASLLVSDDFNQIATQVFPKEKNVNKVTLLGPVLGSILHSANSGTLVDVGKTGFYGQAKDLAKVLTVINGSDTVNVIKNAEGNNLPLYQMVCLAYSHKQMSQYLHDRLGWGVDNVMQDNAVYNNIQRIKNPKIRAEVTIGDYTKQSSNLTEDEVLHLAILYDFFEGLTSSKSVSEQEGRVSGIVGLQATVYSDKNKHFVMQFDLGQNWNFGEDLGSINFKEVLEKYYTSKNPSDLEPIMNIWFKTNQRQYSNLINQILSDYSTAIGTKFNSLDDLKKFIAKTNIKDIKQAFRDNNLEFIEEVHISKDPYTKKNVFNETLENLYNIFNERTQFNQFISHQLNRFIEDSTKAWESIAIDKNTYKAFKSRKWGSWISERVIETVDEDGEPISYTTPYITMTDSDGRLNPMLYSYFIIDSFLSNEYNKMMVGGVYAHPNKNKEGSATKGYLEHSFASRWISQVKRMVIYGATHHSFAQGLKNGVAPTVKMAVVGDIGAAVQNISGMSDNVDSMDGSGFTSPYFSRQQNVSLIDAKVGRNKKTILADMNGVYGLPKLLKWAEYEITNANRRTSWGSDVRLENMFRKMHNLQFNEATKIVYDKTFDNLFYREPNKEVYWKVNHVIINNNFAQIERVQTDIFGNPIPDTDSELITNIKINSIYDLDQLFGGAWAMEYNDELKQLYWSESNLDVVNDIINNNDLKDYMIGYLVNKSAIKVGASNVNGDDVWSNDSDLWYTTMSTKFGGVQMNADHELDEAEVTEMTQMISALEQNGFTHDLATKVYQEIGKLCHDAIAEIHEVLESGDKEALYEIYGKALVKAFQTNNKDTLGLAQSFIKLAQQSFNEKKFDYKIPFSAGTINGIFNSTVTSSLVKEAIRRHYDGVASVLNPSYGIQQYFSWGGYNYNYDELLDLVRKVGMASNPLLADLTIEEAMSGPFVYRNGNALINPFVTDIDGENPIDFEDTLIVYNDAITENGEAVTNEYNQPLYQGYMGNITTNQYDIVKIDNYSKYDWYKNMNSRFAQKLSLRPKNLKGSNTIFTVQGETYSIFEGDITRALHYLNGTSSTSIESLYDELRSNVKKELGLKSKQDKDLTPEQIEWVNNITSERITTVRRAAGTLLPESGRIDLDYIENMLHKNQQKLLNDLADGKMILWQGVYVQPESVKVIPAQIIMGKLYAKQLGLLPGDSITKIKQMGPEFFKQRIQGYYNNNNSDPESYDLVLFDGTGKKLYVKIGGENLNNLYKDTLTPNSEFTTVDNSVYYNGNEIASSIGKKFYKYTDTSGNIHDLVIVENLDRLRELSNSGIYNNTSYNYTAANYKQLMHEQFEKEIANSQPILLSFYDARNRIQTRSIAELDTENFAEIGKALSENQSIQFLNRIKRLADKRYKAFEQSLQFVGTRIPCQSMQSFMALEVVAFTDSDINEVYVPTNQTWLQGSDYDIDKLYILGYSISDNGELLVDASNPRISPFLKQNALRNTIVNSIFDIILNPKNQINLTMPITTSHMQELASRSVLGESAKLMNPYNPSSKYLMQIQNMVGKTVIGNVATGLKSFFALSNLYNTRFRQIYNSIVNQDWDTVRELLTRYSLIKGTQNGTERLITLANVDLSMFENDPEWISKYSVPADITNNIIQLIDFQRRLPDKSLDMGELLNAATDNAKELILKKINADSNWVDLYVYSLMLGEDLRRIGDLMVSEEVTKLVSEYNTNLWTDPQPKNKIKFIDSAIERAAEYAVYKENATEAEIKKATNRAEILFKTLKKTAKGAEEIRILGRLLKINQGLPTDKWGKYSYIKGIETFINDKFKNSSFSLLQFAADENYRREQVENYEKVKTTFNILDVIASVPHFKEMFNILSIDNEVLNRLSVRNRLESIVIDNSIPERGNKLSPNEFRQIKNNIDDFLINSWIKTKNLSFQVPINQKYKVSNGTLINRDENFTINLDRKDSIDSFRMYVEDYIIPTLKEKLPDNAFIKYLCFGLKSDPEGGERGFYKLPFNMMQIDNSQKTKALYEQILRDFNNLNKVAIPELGNLNPVNAFYLYNLIVNKDGFGQASLTRLFEDLVASGDTSLWVVDYNNWIDQQNPENLANSFLNRVVKDDTAEKAEATLINAALTDVETIGFKSEENTSLDRDYNDSTTNIEPLTVSDEDGNTYRQVRVNLPNTNISIKEALKVAKIVDKTEQISKKNKENPTEYDVDFDGVGDWALSERTANLFYNDQLHKQVSEILSSINPNGDANIDYNKLVSQSKYNLGKILYKIIFNSKAFTKIDPNQLTLFETGPTKFYDLKVPTSTKITELVQNLQELKNVKLVTDADLINEDASIRNAKGFIKNGDIYINTDRATDDTVVHEFSHLYLAALKEQSPKEYYIILSEVQDTDLWKDMRENPYYQNKKGSDFDEEVLATMLSNYYSNSKMSDIELDIIEDLLERLNPEFKYLMDTGEIAPFYDSFIHENYKLSQKVATVKNKLINDDIIKEDCK